MFRFVPIATTARERSTRVCAAIPTQPQLLLVAHLANFPHPVIRPTMRAVTTIPPTITTNRIALNRPPRSASRAGLVWRSLPTLTNPWMMMTKAAPRQQTLNAFFAGVNLQSIVSNFSTLKVRPWVVYLTSPSCELLVG